MRYIRINASLEAPCNPAMAADPFAGHRTYQLVDLGNGLAAGAVHGGGDMVLDNLAHHEFSTLFHGTVTFEAGDGQCIAFKAGDSFVLPATLSGRLSSSADMRRSFLTCSRDGDGMYAHYPIAIDPAAVRKPCPGPAQDLLLTPPPLTVASEAYRSPNGVFQAGIWQCGAFDRRPARASHYELMQIIEGEAALQNEGDGEEPFQQGQSVLIHPGVRYTLRAKASFAKVYATVNVAN